MHMNSLNLTIMGELYELNKDVEIPRLKKRNLQKKKSAQTNTSVLLSEDRG